MRRGVSTLLAGLLFAVPGPASAQQAPVHLSYVAWDDCIATTAVVRSFVEDALGVSVRRTEVSAADMWRLVAEGTADAHVCGWLPVTHGRYIDRHREAVENLGPHISGGARIGWVVPDYVPAQTVPDLRNQAALFGGRIVGIDPEAGLMTTSRKALKDYGLADFVLEAGSGSRMAEVLGDAIEARAPVVVTGWTPHWMFGLWPVRYLEDPLQVFGGDEVISTVVRKTLVTERPRLRRALNRFSWSIALLQEVMAEIRRGVSPDEAARRFLARYPDQVRVWKGL